MKQLVQSWNDCTLREDLYVIRSNYYLLYLTLWLLKVSNSNKIFLKTIAAGRYALNLYLLNVQFYYVSYIFFRDVLMW